ncbi:hypothetical protein jhhlp_001493 [Lomentospora prolificans]|uniref:VWFA domain-containing protein n=1 Tax=Lomentospora prolificans TaxID=41688 RepID=A0A2N3NID9_9PEZI|nr:hypothetical protein jhhlp_001493 [Lomentospora prolificans]
MASPNSTPAVLLHPATSSTTSTNSDPSSPMSSKSFFGGIKDKIRRRSPSPKVAAGPVQSAPVQSAPVRTTPAAVNAFHDSSFPGRNRSGATRRPPSINDPPPAYGDVVGETPSRRAGSSAVRAPSPARSIASVITTPEDPYAFLSTFDTVFVIDDSGSMRGRSWREVREALRTITPICADHDSDGIDIYFLNHKSKLAADAKAGKAAGGYRGFKNPSAVEALFESIQPFGGTPTGTRLQNIIKPYIQLLEANKDEMESVKPVNIIVITDGVPSDDVEGVLLSTAKKLDKIDAPPYQVGVQFFQVGNEPGARDALKELDDGLTEMMGGDVRDMVDTVTWSGQSGQVQTLTGDAILKVVLGAVVRRLDRR